MYTKVLIFSRRFFAYVFVISAIFTCAFFAFISNPTPAHAATGINKQINFQGRLLNSQGATVPDGFYNIQFKIYQDGDGCVSGGSSPCSGTLKWTEAYLNNNTQGVQVKNGFLSVNLGSVTAFGASIDWNQDTIWLSMNIGSTNTTCTPFASCSPDGEMLPMKRLSSTPYALNAGQLGGLDSSKFVQIGQGVQGDATNNSSIFINKTGTGNLLELQNNGNGALAVTNAGDVTFGASANHTLTVATAAGGVAGKSLTVAAGNAGTGAAVNGGDLLLQAGAASGTGTTGSVIVRSNAADSSGAFQIQKANNSVVFNVNTSTSSVQVASLIDTTTATTLALGTTNATAISLDKNTSVSGSNTFTVGTGLTSLGGGLSVTAGDVDIAKSAAFKKGTDFSTTGSSNNVSFADASLIRLTGASAQTITGIANGRDGYMLTIVNAASQAATISNNSGSSTAANRIITGTGADISLPAGASTTLFYDSGASLWRTTSSVAATGGYIQNQNAAQQTSANFWISGTGRADTSLLTPSLDVASAGTLTVGGTTATTIQLGNTALSSGTQTINIGTNNTAGGTTNVLIGHGTSAAGTVTIQGTTKLSSLGAATANVAALCRDTSTTTLLACDANTTGRPFLQGGNTFGAAGNLGTNDNFALNLRTNGTTKLTLSTAGDLQFAESSSTHTLGVQTRTTNAAGTGLTISAGSAGAGGSPFAGGALTLQGGDAAGTGSEDGGSIYLKPGLKTGGGEGGQILLQNTGARADFLVAQTATGQDIVHFYDRIASGGSGHYSNYMLLGGTCCTVTDPYEITFSNQGVETTMHIGADDATDDNGNNLQLLAGSTSFTNGNGGSIILTGGSKDGTGTAGGVYVQNKANSTSAFKVQNAALSTLLNVDSTNKILNLGSGYTLPIPNFSTPTLTTTGGSIANGTTYYYAITAIASSVETEKSPVISYTVSSGTNTNKINLSWTQSVGATSYKIYRNTSNSFSSGSLLLTTIGSGSTITYSDTGSATSSGTPPTTTYTPTLFRADAASTDPFGNGQTTSLGSMYYNTTSGEFQCYKDAGVGGTWADCGVTTLQGAYSNATSTTQPAIKLDSTRGTLNIQDANTTIGADLLNIRTGNSSGLGTNMFGVGNTGQITMQNSSDQISAMRALNSGGTYLINTNTSSGYFITNTTRQLSNEIINPSFEAGGNLTSGEQGWNGPAQGSFVNSSANAHTGNYELQVTPNSTTLKFYAGTYYTVQSGDVISFEGWMKTGGSANGTGGIIIEGYDKDKGLISSASDAASLPGTSYALAGTTYTVPSNVAYVRVAAIVNSGASTGTYYFDDAYLSSSNRGQQLFQNTIDSTTAFRIQSASAGQTLFTADTTNNIVKIGDSTGTNTATTILQLDGATADPSTGLTSRNGGLFYRSDSGSLKAILGGAVVDVCTTAVVCSGYGASAGSIVQLQATTPGTTQTGNFNISGTGILTQLQTQDQSSASTNSSNLTVRTGNATGSSSNSGSLTLDVGTATGTLGSITIGHASVSTTMPGSLDIQGSSALKLGTASSAGGSILFRTSAGSNTITLQAPGSNPTSSWNMVLPQNHGNAGECLKDSTGTGTLAFGGCDPGSAISLQDAYTNSASPATITLADGKDLKIVAQDTTTDPNFLIDLQCTTSCGSNGRFAVRDSSGNDMLTVKPNGGGIILASETQIGSSTTDATQTNFHLDSYNGTTDNGTCSTTTNQGALYYNTAMGSIRGCVNGSWGDISNPDTLGLLTFGIIPSSGSASGAYDLPSLVTPGVSGPCKVSWASSTSVTVQSCVAYSSGKRINVASVTLNTNSATGANTNLTTTNRWGHVCIDSSTGAASFTNTSGALAATSNMPTFSISSPVVCLADVQGSSSSAGVIDNIYDVRTFTSTIKEAVNTTTASELGMLVDAGSTGLVPTATCTTGTCSGKLYGIIVATDGSTSSSTPNSIVASVGPAYVKATAGTAGQFIKSGPTSGYGETVTAIPNNAFYYSPGNTRTSWSTTCTAASNCLGSLYVNFIVR